MKRFVAAGCIIALIISFSTQARKAAMFISRFLRQRGEDMTLEEIIDKSKEICKNQKEKGCSQCPIVGFTCIDINGHLTGNATGLIKLRDYLDTKENKKGSQPKENKQKETKGRVKK